MFQDTVLQAFLAARELSGGPDPVDAARTLLENGGRDAALAIAIAAGLLAGRDPDQATQIARDLVARAGTRQDGTRFPLATAAVEVATALEGDRRRAVEEDLLALLGAPAAAVDPPLERVRFVGRLASLRDENACMALHRLTRDLQYVVRLAAARRLASLGETAAAVLRSPFEGDLRHAEERYGAAGSLDLDRRFPTAIQCWVLPSLHVASQSRDWSRALLERWVGLAWERADPGIEASLAQGLKFAAAGANVPFEEVLEWSRRLLEQARFFYSAINLLHAVALCGARSTACEATARQVIATVRPHPLVARAATLSERALGGDTRRWIWDDEVEVSRRADSGPADAVVAQGWRALDPEASGLMADVIVALNLIEGDSRVATQREARLKRACQATLPTCLAGDAGERARLQVLGTNAMTGSPCPPECGMRLCPYPARSEPTFRGELNEAFCREQARRQGPLEAFWDQMEQRVRL